MNELRKREQRPVRDTGLSIRKKNDAAIITDNARRDRKYELPIALSALGAILAYGAYTKKDKFVKILEQRSGEAGKKTGFKMLKKMFGSTPQYQGLSDIMQEARNQTKKKGLASEIARNAAKGAGFAAGVKLVSDNVWDKDAFFIPSALEKLATPDPPAPVLAKIYDELLSSPKRAFQAAVWVAATAKVKEMLEKANKNRGVPSNTSGKARIIIEMPETQLPGEQYAQARKVKLAEEDITDLIEKGIANIVDVDILDPSLAYVDLSEGVAGRNYQTAMMKMQAMMVNQEMEKRGSRRVFNKDLLDSVKNRVTKWGKMVFSEVDEAKVLREGLRGGKDYVSMAQKALNEKGIQFDNPVFKDYLGQEIQKLKNIDESQLSAIENTAKKMKLLTMLGVATPAVLVSRKKGEDASRQA